MTRIIILNEAIILHSLILTCELLARRRILNSLRRDVPTQHNIICVIFFRSLLHFEEINWHETGVQGQARL